MWIRADVVLMPWPVGYVRMAPGHTEWTMAVLVPIESVARQIRLWEELDYGRASMESDFLDREVEELTH